MSWLITLFLFVSDADVERLRRTAPTYLTTETAQAHLEAARFAGAEHRVDPALLLSIAHHESRYILSVRTREAHGMVSCGVMTPEPKRKCVPEEMTLLGGYLAGAKHLRVWLDACKQNLQCALTGYAGGYYLINYCRTKQHKSCSIPAVFKARAARIRG